MQATQNEREVEESAAGASAKEQATEPDEEAQSVQLTAEFREWISQFTTDNVQNIKLIAGGVPAQAEMKTLTRSEDITYVLESLQEITITKEASARAYSFYIGGIGLYVLITTKEDTYVIHTISGSSNSNSLLMYEGKEGVNLWLEGQYPYMLDPKNKLSNEEYMLSLFDYPIEQVDLDEVLED